jgi:hypothetical protein
MERWKSHWEELNAREGEWRRRYEALLRTVDPLQEEIRAAERSRLANERADAAERKLKAIRRSMMRLLDLQPKNPQPKKRPRRMVHRGLVTERKRRTGPTRGTMGSGPGCVNPKGLSYQPDGSQDERT